MMPPNGSYSGPMLASVPELRPDSRNSLQISPSFTQCYEDDPLFTSGVFRKLHELDNKGTGQLDIRDVARCVHEIFNAEKQQRTLRNIAITIAVFLFLTLLALCGVIAAVVIMAANTQSNDMAILVQKGSDQPVTVGMPSYNVIYDPASVTDIVDLYNNTQATELTSTGTRRRNLLAPGKCATPRVKAIAVSTFDYVKQQCAYVSKTGTDSKVVFKVGRNLNGELSVGDMTIDACGTYRDQVRQRKGCERDFTVAFY